MILKRIVLCGILGLALACSEPTKTTSNDKGEIAPEGGTGQVFQNKLFLADQYIVTTANKHATHAGIEILQNGGNAIDASVAIQMVLNLVEPQSSGLGGGLFYLYYDMKTQKMLALDGREVVPQAADDKLFLQSDGTPKGFFEAVVGGKSVGVPGTLKALKTMHEKHGKLPWSELFVPAIRLAKNGFNVSPRLHYLLNKYDYLKNSPNARAYFYDENGNAVKEGAVLKNPAFAETLRQIAEQGIKPFYEGQIGQAIAKTVQNAHVNPGTLTIDDLKSYDVVHRDPLCIDYRDHKVCGLPPVSGGICVMQILGVLENFDLKQVPLNSEKFIHLFSQSAKLVFADRALYLGDPDFVAVPVNSLIDKTYLKKRSSLIGETDIGVAVAGDVKSKMGWHLKRGEDQSLELPSTSHFNVIDKEGNAVAITSTIENGFGSTLMTNGFILNNELTDFSFVAMQDGLPVANRIQPGKRPRSSMSPLFVFDKEGKLVLLIGSAGGSRIIQNVAQTIVAVLDYGLDVQSAISLPHVVDLNSGKLELEENTTLVDLKDALEKRGHKVVIKDLNSGVHGIHVKDGKLTGGADPRREGFVLGL